MTRFLFLVLLSVSAAAQKDYAFDYIAEYDFRSSDTAKVQKRWFWINSNDNAYNLQIIDADKGRVQLYFIDVDGKTSSSFMDRELFFSGAAVATNCNFVHDMPSGKFFKEEKYALRMTDTLVDGKQQQLFVCSGKDPKRIKKEKLGRTCYVYGSQPEFKVPFLMNGFDYHLWKQDPQFPSGLPVEKFHITFEGKKTGWYRLAEYAPLKVIFIIPKECAD